MTRGLRIEFRFVPFPQEIWREGLDLTESEFKLLGYLLYHQARFGQSIIALSDDEMLNGRKHNGERVDRGCGIKGRNNLKSARQKLIEREWLDCEQDRFGTKYKIQLCEVLEEVSKLDRGVSKTDTPQGIQNGQSKRPKRTPETSKTDTPNKEEKELYIEQNNKSTNATEIPNDSDLIVSEIARAHPRHEKPVETEREIVFQIERLSKRMGSDGAAAYLLQRTLLFAKAAAAWPRDEFRKSFPASVRWFRSACFEEKEANWEYQSNEKCDSKAQRVQDESLDAIQTAVSRINGRAAGATESGVPRPERDSRDSGVVLDGTGGDPPRSRSTASGRGPEGGNA